MHTALHQLPVEVRVEGEEGKRLRAHFYSGHKTVAVESVILLQKATKNPLTQESLLEVFGKLGDTPFTLKGVDCSDLKGNLFLPVSELNRLRRSAISQLNLEPAAAKDAGSGKSMRLSPLCSAGASMRKSDLAILVSDLEEAAFFSPIVRNVLLEINSAEEFQRARGCLYAWPNIVPFFPAILFEKECSRLVQILDKAFCFRIVANNSGLGLAAAQKGIGWVAGPALNCTNPYAVRALEEEGGAQGAFLSLELNATQIREVCTASDREIWMFVMGPLLLMTTRQCLLRDNSHCRKKACDEQCLLSCRNYAVWYDELGVPFHIYKKAGAHTQIFNNAVLFIPEAVRLLRGMVSYFVLDIRSFPFYDLALADKKKIVDYLIGILAGELDREQDRKAIRKIKETLPETTTGHFKRGL
jgi:putative protease